MADPVPTGGRVLTAGYATLDTVRAGFVAHAQAFPAADTSLTAAHGDALDGAGQFGDELEPGAGTFLRSWQAVFETLGTECELIAGSVERLGVNLRTVDDLVCSVDLSPPPGSPGESPDAAPFGQPDHFTESTSAPGASTSPQVTAPVDWLPWSDS